MRNEAEDCGIAGSLELFRRQAVAERKGRRDGRCGRAEDPSDSGRVRKNCTTKGCFGGKEVGECLVLKELKPKAMKMV